MAIKILASAILFLLRNVEWKRHAMCGEINHHTRALHKLAS